MVDADTELKAWRGDSPRQVHDRHRRGDVVNATDTLQRLCAALTELREEFDANAAADYLGSQVADLLDGVLIEALLDDATGRAS